MFKTIAFATAALAALAGLTGTASASSSCGLLNSRSFVYKLNDERTVGGILRSESIVGRISFDANGNGTANSFFTDSGTTSVVRNETVTCFDQLDPSPFSLLNFKNGTATRQIVFLIGGSNDELILQGSGQKRAQVGEAELDGRYSVGDTFNGCSWLNGNGNYAGTLDGLSAGANVAYEAQFHVTNGAGTAYYKRRTVLNAGTDLTKTIQCQQINNFGAAKITLKNGADAVAEVMTAYVTESGSDWAIASKKTSTAVAGWLVKQP